MTASREQPARSEKRRQVPPLAQVTIRMSQRTDFSAWIGASFGMHPAMKRQVATDCSFHPARTGLSGQ